MGQVTISGNTFEVYGDEDGFKTFMAGELDTTDYDAASSNQKRKALVGAVRWIDRENWQGTQTDSDQDNAFPRDSITDCEGNDVSGTTPTEVENAAYILANILLGDNAAADNETQGTNVKKVGAGSASVEFFRPGDTDGSGNDGSIFPTRAQKLLKCFMDSSYTIITPTVTGTDVDSSFDSDDYTVDEGVA